MLAPDWVERTAACAPAGAASAAETAARDRRERRMRRGPPAVAVAPLPLGGCLPPPAPLERPPQLDEVGRLAQRRARGLLETAQPVAQRVGVDVQGASGVLDPHLLVKPGAQRRLELGAEAAQFGERREVARLERVAERLVGQDGGADREIREAARALLAERERRLQRAAGERKGVGQVGQAGGRA